MIAEGIPSVLVQGPIGVEVFASLSVVRDVVGPFASRSWTNALDSTRLKDWHGFSKHH